MCSSDLPDTFVVVIAGVALAIAGADYLVTRPTEPPGLTGASA